MVNFISLILGAIADTGPQITVTITVRATTITIETVLKRSFFVVATCAFGLMSFAYFVCVVGFHSFVKYKQVVISTVVAAAAATGTIADRRAATDSAPRAEMEIPLFARMIDGRNPKSVRTREDAGRNVDRADRPELGEPEEEAVPASITRHRASSATSAPSTICSALPTRALTSRNTKIFPWRRRARRCRRILLRLRRSP